MRIGVGLPNTIPGTPGRRLVEWSRRAEELDFKGLSTIGRVVFPTHDELISLTAAAAVTERIELFTNVLLAPTRDPVLLAREAASIDQISEGRFVLGIAVGWRPDDFSATDKGYHDRGQRMTDDVELMLRVWRGDQVKGSEKVLSPTPTNGESVPLAFGGSAPAALRRMARYGIGWTAGGAAPEAAAGAFETAREAWRAGGRDGEPRLWALVYFGLGDPPTRSPRPISPTTTVTGGRAWPPGSPRMLKPSTPRSGPSRTPEPTPCCGSPPPTTSRSSICWQRRWAGRRRSTPRNTASVRDVVSTGETARSSGIGPGCVTVVAEIRMYRPPAALPGRAATRRKTRSTARIGGTLFVVVVLVGALVATGAIWTNTFGAGERFDHLVDRVRLAVNPPPDREIVPTVQVTEPPADPVGAPGDESVGPTRSGEPAPDATRRPPRRAINFKLRTNPDTMFISQQTNTWCASAGVQIALAIQGLVDNSPGLQKRIHERLGEWETRQDAKAGGWGPSSMAEALAAYGVPGYEVRAYENRNQSLREAAKAMVRTGAPVDPHRVARCAHLGHDRLPRGCRSDRVPRRAHHGHQRVRPVVPTVSTIWGPSDPAGTLQDLAEIKRNFLQWERPEGSYPERDGKYLIVVPTMPVGRPDG